MDLQTKIKVMKWIKVLLFITLFSFIPHNPKIDAEAMIEKMIEKGVIPFDVVKVTMYTIDPAQTDSTPLITASGFKLDSINPKKHKIIAVSRDLKRKYKFGQKVKIKGAGKWDGVYTVRDVMASRWRKKIDILVNPDDDMSSFRKVRIYNVSNIESGGSSVR